ncbi:hypothetical protein ASD54_21760 [Rhizobium sp. Root149]|nr:hypothetical protein ASD54_21760 [Rhizobium sp. Root149]
MVIGAGGFLGRRLVEKLASGEQVGPSRRTSSEILAVDAVPLNTELANVTELVGDIRDEAFRRSILTEPVDVVFHLAAIPGGAAEADPAIAWDVNVLVWKEVLNLLSARSANPRVVFTSSVAVFGVPMPPDLISDDTIPLPTMSYGGHKLIGEILLADASRRGEIDGIGVRLPGIVARPKAPTGHLSAFMSDIFHALAAGEPFVCPVSADATSWFLSRERCVENLLHASCIASDFPADRRCFTLPALHLSYIELVAGIAEHFGPQVHELIRYEPNERLQAQFGAYPRLETEIADRLGFRNDGNARELVGRVLGINRS